MSNKMPEYDALIKVRVMGDAETGKSHLIERFIKDQYTESYMPENTEGVKTVNIDGLNVKAQLSETKKDHRGSEKHEDLDKADAIVLVCDVTSQASFEKMKQLYQQSVTRFAKSNTPIIIIGNKSDQNNARVVSSETLRAFAEANNHHRSCQFFEASAKTGANVNDAFKGVLKEAMHEKKLLHRLTSEQHKDIEKMVHLLNSDNRKKLPFGIGQKRFEAMAQEKVDSMINKLGMKEITAYQVELKRQMPANTQKLTAGDQARFDLSLKLNARKNDITKAENTYRSKNEPTGS